MKKQYVFCRTALLLCVWLFSSAAWAYDFEADGIYYNILSSDDKTVEVASGNYSGKVTIPATVSYNGTVYSVTTIGESAFGGCSGLTEITIPEGVISIGNRAFVGCDGLTSITIPESVTTIGNYAFASCNGLTSVTIGEGVTTIGDRAFEYCDKLTSVTIGEGVTTIGDDAFSHCEGLTSVTIPEGVISIGDETFSYCYGLTEVTIPESVTTIGDEAFYECTGLTSVTIGSGVTSISFGAFSDCTGLTSVTIGSGVTSISNGAFAYCEGLTSVTIPESVTTIGSSAFYGCDGLTSVTAYNPIPVDIVITYEWGDTYSSFEGDRTNCTLYVPAESVELYKVVEGWKEFGEILPIDESSAITETRQEQADGHVTVYNLQGVLVLETDDAADLKTLQNGAYIVNGKKMIIVR